MVGRLGAVREYVDYVRHTRAAAALGQRARFLFMPRPRVVSAGKRPYKHVALSDGDWINLKRKLNAGEAGELYDATYRSNVGSSERSTVREVRMSRFQLDRMFFYILEWSFIDDENKPLPLTAENIRLLDLETTEEIHAAITELEEENTRLENEAKKAKEVVAAPAPASVETASNSASVDSSPKPLASTYQHERSGSETNS